MNKATASEKIQTLHSQASAIASAEVIRLARKILKANSDLEEFIMGMGTWFFSNKDGDNVSTGPEFKELDDFISEWDETIRITGEPMRFTANGEIRRDW